MAANRLARETSPYLLQHAQNPVDWWAWGPDALAEAARRDVPILLSVGYAACHWCHVMAHECFERADLAAQMNRLFVNIKVDREERPDLDAIYQQALALTGQPGGWPLTMFLTPKAEPFWGGTYFPPEPRYGRPAFGQIMDAVGAAWQGDRAQITQQVASFAAALGELAEPQPGRFDARAIDAIAARILQALDPVHGGLAGAPKFPQVPLLKLLWAVGRTTPGGAMRDGVRLALDRMAAGGIYDHLGGGFARYSVDAEWLVPHFEKMLYDNAALIEIYTQAWAATRRPLYAERVAETIDWIGREMISPDGPAFAAALDADSEGEEGRFYLWRADEVRRLLGADFAAFAHAYDVTEEGNFEGATILNRLRSRAPADEAMLKRARAKLLAARDTRMRPQRDDKVLADWNGLMIAALAQAGAVFGRADWLDMAARAFTFVTTQLCSDGALAHSWCRGQAKHRATLDDHAALLRAALALHEASGDPALLAQAVDHVAALDRDYASPDGGYFFSSALADDLILRPRGAIDHATPAGNGQMVEGLARLYHLTGDESYRVRAQVILDAFGGEVARAGLGMVTMLGAARLLDRATTIVIVGAPGDPARDALLAAAFAADLPERIVQPVAPGAALPPSHPAAGKGLIDHQAAAYLCRGQTCSPPIADPARFARHLAEA